MNRQKWSKKEEDLIKNLSSKLCLSEAAEVLNRSYDSVKWKARSMGLVFQGKITNSVLSLSNKESQKQDEKTIDFLKHQLKNIETPEFKLDKSKSNIEQMVIHIGDWHFGQIVKDTKGSIIYDKKIAEDRILRFYEQILKLLDRHITKSSKIKVANIVDVGDNANGEGIYPGQPYEQEYTPPLQVMVAIKLKIRFIKSLLDRGLIVNYYGVPGNHGRTGKDTNPASNWDVMVYLLIRWWSLLENVKNINVKFSEGEYINFKVFDWNFHARHKAPAQSETASGRARFGGWKSIHDSDAVMYGHVHHWGAWDSNGQYVFRTGSPKGGCDNFAESLALTAEPIQLVFGVSRKHLLTFFYAIDLRSTK